MAEDLFAEWRARAEDLGVTRATASEWTGRGRDLRPVSDHEIAWLFEFLAGPAGLTERRSSFDRKAAV